MCSLIFGGTFFILFFDLYSSSQSNSDQPIIAKATVILNDVRLKKKDQFDWSKSSKNQSIRNGDQVFAGENSTATVELLDGQKVQILENSLIKFDQKQNVKNFKIMFGSMKAQVKKNEMIEVTICGVKHSVKSDSDDEMTIINNDDCIKPEIKLQKSKVDLPLKKKNRAIASLTKKLIEKRKPVVVEVVPVPEPVIVQLATPALNQQNILMKASDKSKRFEWSQVPYADYYVVNIADAESSNDILQKIETKNSFYEFNPIAGVYQYKYSIEARSDKKEFLPATSSEGQIQITFLPVKLLNPIKSFVMNARTSDQPAKPVDFEIKWAKVPTASYYKIEFSEDPLFTQVTETDKIRTHSYKVNLNDFGKKYYRVKAFSIKNQEITKSDRLAYTEYNKNFNLMAPQIDTKNKNMSFFFQKTEGQFIRLSWVNTDIKKAPGHYVEISTTEDFSKIIKTYTTEKEFIVLNETIAQGQYYWRVKSYSPSLISDWSDTAALKIKSPRKLASEIKKSTD